MPCHRYGPGTGQSPASSHRDISVKWDRDFTSGGTTSWWHEFAYCQLHSDEFQTYNWSITTHWMAWILDTIIHDQALLNAPTTIAKLKEWFTLVRDSGAAATIPTWPRPVYSLVVCLHKGFICWGEADHEQAAWL